MESPPFSFCETGASSGGTAKLYGVEMMEARSGRHISGFFLDLMFIKRRRGKE